MFVHRSVSSCRFGALRASGGGWAPNQSLGIHDKRYDELFKAASMVVDNSKSIGWFGENYNYGRKDANAPHHVAFDDEVSRRGR